MSRDTILKDENGGLYSYDNLRTQSYLEGHAPGIACVVEYLLERSKEFFGLKQDEKAKLLRDLSDEVKKLAVEAQKRAKEHESQYPALVEVAWAEQKGKGKG